MSRNNTGCLWVTPGTVVPVQWALSLPRLCSSFGGHHFPPTPRPEAPTSEGLAPTVATYALQFPLLQSTFASPEFSVNDYATTSGFIVGSVLPSPLSA